MELDETLRAGFAPQLEPTCSMGDQSLAVQMERGNNAGNVCC